MDPQSSPWVNQVNLYWNGWWLGWWEWATPFLETTIHIFRGFKYRKNGSEIESMNFFASQIGIGCIDQLVISPTDLMRIAELADVTLVELECLFSRAFPYLRDNSDCWWLDVWDWNLKPPIHGAYDSKTIQPRYSHQSQTPGNYEWKIIYSILGK